MKSRFFTICHRVWITVCVLLALAAISAFSVGVWFWHKEEESRSWLYAIVTVTRDTDPAYARLLPHSDVSAYSVRDLEAIVFKHHPRSVKYFSAALYPQSPQFFGAALIAAGLAAGLVILRFWAPWLLGASRLRP